MSMLIDAGTDSLQMAKDLLILWRRMMMRLIVNGGQSDVVRLSIVVVVVIDVDLLRMTHRFSFCGDDDGAMRSIIIRDSQWW